jgi:hypothetical protein
MYAEPWLLRILLLVLHFLYAFSLLINIVSFCVLFFLNEFDTAYFVCQS